MHRDVRCPIDHYDLCLLDVVVKFAFHLEKTISGLKYRGRKDGKPFDRLGMRCMDILQVGFFLLLVAG